MQSNAVESVAGVLRGVHAHRVHDDYLSVLSGRATIGLYDLLQDSAIPGLTTLMELAAYAKTWDAPTSVARPAVSADRATTQTSQPRLKRSLRIRRPHRPQPTRPSLIAWGN